MGADGHINITNPQEIERFLMNVMEDSIYTSLESQYPNDDCYDSYNVNLSKDDLIIQFIAEDENVPDEEIIVKTITMDPSHYWEIYNYLLRDFHYRLNQDHISDKAYEYINDDIEINSYIDMLDSNGMNYTYWDNVGYYNNTIFEYFDNNETLEVEQIYDDIENFSENEVWYNTFFNLFPDFETLLNYLNSYKDYVSTESYQVWT